MLEPRPHQRTRVGRAFSLIELLVAMGVVSILSGILLPALTGVRESARRVVCARQLAGHMQVMAVYAGDFDDFWPYAWREDRTAPDLPNIGKPPVGYSDWYGAVAGLWHLPVLDAYDENPFHESLFCPSDRDWKRRRDAVSARLGVPPRRLRATLLYTMSMAMFLDPRALDPERPAYKPRYYIGQRQSDVVYPTMKAALFEGLPFHDPRYLGDGIVLFPNAVNVAASDGSVVYRSTVDMIPGIVFDELVLPGREELAREADKLDFTPHGVRGRDW